MKRAALVVLAAVFCGAAAGVFIVAFKGAPGGDAPALPSPMAVRPPAATFDPVFEPCAHCHQIGPGARMATGPVLQGVIGRKAGTLAGYPFSPAMKDSGLVWDKATLNRFIAAPQSLVPGTRMIYAGMDDAGQRQALVDFIAKAGAGSP